MRKNRISALFLVMAITLSLCACGSAPKGTETVTEGPAVSGKTVSEPKPTEAPAATETPAPTQAPAPTQTPAPTQAPVVTEPPAMEDPDQAFSVGTTLNNTYVNEFFGLGVTLDENWTFSTQQEIEDLNGITADLINDESFQRALESGNVYTDMMATADDGLVSINATIEKLGVMNSLALDENTYIDVALSSSDFEEAFESMGVPLVVLEKSTAVLAGVEHPCIFLEGDVEGISLFEKIIPVKVGSYVLAITVCTVGENIIDGLLAFFYAV